MVGRGRFLVAVLAVLGAVVALVASGAGTQTAALNQAAAGQPKDQAATSRPNVIVIETDDQTVESMKVMQNVNSLIGAQGATFSNSLLNFSLCCPSRATFLTGQYAHNHGVWSNHAPNGGFDRFEPLHANSNLAVWLQHAGYYTAMIGKYLNNYKNQPPIPPGWSEWHATAPYEQRVYSYPINNNGRIVQYGQAPKDYKDDVLTRKAVGLVNQRATKTQPFFLWLTYTAPHVGGPPTHNPPQNCTDAAKPPVRYANAFANEPLPKPPNFNEADVSDKPKAIRRLPLLNSSQIATIRRKYRCELESLLGVDDGVKKVIDALKAKGALDNTLIIYTTDNGYFHGEHRIPGDKEHVYEESIRAPLEMRGPGIPQGATINPLVTNADLAPTIVDAANANHGSVVMDGRSLLPVVRHPVIDNNRELLVEEPTYKAIRTERYVYVEYTTGEKELYDLQNDPYELQSLQDDPAYASVKAVLAQRLQKLKNCSGATCRVYQPDPSP
ncbi:MAG: sulfatase family protein [Solirubrobacterales bacterium]